MTSRRGLTYRAGLAGLIAFPIALTACGQHSTAIIQMLPGTMSPNSGHSTLTVNPPHLSPCADAGTHKPIESEFSKLTPGVGCALAMGVAPQPTAARTETSQRPRQRSTPQQIFATMTNPEWAGEFTDELVGIVMTGVGEYWYRPNVGVG